MRVAMSFDRTLLPDPIGYFEEQGLRLTGRGKWRTAECRFHGGSDSMRINVARGGWCCMNCGAKGGDVLAYHMRLHDMEFVPAARQLGAWVDDGAPILPLKPAPLSPRAALQVLGVEANLAAVAAANLANGVALSELDRARLLTASRRISRLAEVYQ
jgi:hypothetical protein